MTGWAYPVYSGDNGLKVVSNQASGNAGGAWSNSYLSGNYGPDLEAYYTISTLVDSPDIMCRISGEGSAAVDGYHMNVDLGTSPDTWSLNRVDDSAFTQLGASVSSNIAATHQIGLGAVGSTIQGYYDGVSVLSRTDGTYSSAGKIGLGTYGISNRFDDFGGGTVSAAATSSPIFPARMPAAILAR